MADLKKHPLLYVEYADHASSAGWRDAPDVDLEPVLIASVGWLIKENKHRLVLAASHDKRTGNFRYPLSSSARVYIEKRCIVKKIRLKCPPQIQSNANHSL